MGGKLQKSAPDMVAFTLFRVTMAHATDTLAGKGKSPGILGAVRG